MPSATVTGFSTILDARGNPTRTGPSGTMHVRTDRDDKLRPAPRNHYGDYIDLLAPRNGKRLVSEGRAVGSRGQPYSLLDQKSDYVAASKFRPTFLGSDSAYGDAALPIIEGALQICNLRGWLYDWSTTWRLCVPTLAKDGRVYVLLTRWGDTAWPAIQILETHRIGQRDDGKEKIERDDAFTTSTDGKTVRGFYAGLRIKNGIIYNPQGTEVAYRVLGPDPEGRDDQDISARDLFPIARPKAFSEGATPPDIAAALFDFIGLELAQSAALTTQINDAKLTVVETNESGKPDPALEAAGMGPKLDGTPTQLVDEGEWRYVKSGKGKLDLPAPPRPTDQWQNFDARVHSRGAAGLGWRSEMLDPAALKAAANRALQDQINTLIQGCFDTINRGATRVENYVASVLSGEELRVLPLHAETRAWGIARPPWFEVDRASAKYDLDDVAAGRVSMMDLHERDGRSTIEVFTKNARVYMTALQVHKKFPDVPLERIMGDLGATVQRTGAPDSGQSPNRPEQAAGASKGS